MEDLVKSEIGVSVRLVTEQVNVSLEILALQLCTVKNGCGELHLTNGLKSDLAV